jgi:transcriptional regulator with XRE-family HTH domain
LWARLRRPLPPAERAAYDERVLAIRTILELTEHRQERRITQRTIAQRMGVSQPVIA